MSEEKENYTNADCGDVNNISDVSLLMFRYTKPAYNPTSHYGWCEFLSNKGNIGFYKLLYDNPRLVTKYGTFEKDYFKNKYTKKIVYNYHIKHDGSPIIRVERIRQSSGKPKWITEYFDMDNNQYYYSKERSEGLFKGVYHSIYDMNGKKIMHLSHTKPYAPISFNFYMDPYLDVSPTTYSFRLSWFVTWCAPNSCCLTTSISTSSSLS